MNHDDELAPCLIGRGTLGNPHDMLRALETLENLEYRFSAHGDLVDEGRAALVKLMADPVSATLVVNGCLFLNVMSFRYMDFEPESAGCWRFVLHGDGSTLELVSIPDPDDEAAAPSRPRLLLEETAPDFESLIALDDEDDEE